MTPITRTPLALGLALVLGFAGASQLEAQTGYDPRRTITVGGEAEVKVAPDEGSISLGITVSDPDVNAARRTSDERFRELVKALKTAGIAERDIRSVSTTIQPRYDYVEGKQIFREYVAERMVVATLRDLTRFEDAVTAALLAGGTNVGNLELRTSKLRQYRDQARQNAVRAAREKAEAMAGELGMKIVKPITIGEADMWESGWPRPMMQNAMTRAGGDDGANDGSGGLAAGEISVRARVTVTFEME